MLNRCKEVLITVVSQKEYLSEAKWKEVLPKFFINNCAEPRTKEEVDKWLEIWRKLPWEQRKKSDREWSVEDWIYWFRPEMRSWYWWDAKVVNPDLFQITVEVDGFPFPSGSLKWLILACGAISFEEES